MIILNSQFNTKSVLKQACALILLSVIFVTSLLMLPGKLVFAADPGIAPVLFNACFSWYSDEPGIDSNGLYYGSAMSDGLSSTGTYSFGQQINLNSAGSYISWNFETGFMDFTSPVGFISIFWDYTYSCPTSNFIYQIYPKNAPALSFDIFYQYDQPLVTVDGRQYRRTNIIFDHNNVAPGAITIKVSADIDNGGFGNTIPLAFMYGGYRSTSNTYTNTELIQLQSNIINAFNMARLADFAGLDSSSVDLSNIETALSSLYTLLDNNLDTIVESLADINFYLEETQNFISDIDDIFNDFYGKYTYNFLSFGYSQFYNNIYNSDFILQSNDFYDSSIYYGLRISGSGPFYLKSHFHFNEQISSNDITILYTFQNGLNINNSQWLNDALYYVINYSGGTDIFIFLQSERTFDTRYIIYNIVFPDNVFIKSKSTFYSYFLDVSNLRFYEVVMNYLGFLVNGFANSQTADDITSTADTVTQHVNDIVAFETQQNEALEDAQSSMDLSIYPIDHQSTGIQFMRDYSQNVFNNSTQFRLYIILPVIFCLILFFMHRRSG